MNNSYIIHPKEYISIFSLYIPFFLISGGIYSREPTLNNYFGDKFNNSIKKIDSGIYNYKWQEIHYYKMIIKKEWI